MSRTSAALMAFLISILLGADAFAAEADRPHGDRPMWGTVTKVSADSVTIAPEVAVARRRSRNAANQKPAAAAPEKPPERMFALAKDHTEFAFAEVGMKRMMNDGTTLRTLTAPEPAAAADVKPGQLVQITPARDDAGIAKMIIIAWSHPGTVVKVSADELTFRPAADTDAAPKHDAAAGADKPADPAAPPAADQQLTINKSATRVTIAEVTDEHPSPNGRGVVQSIAYRNGTLADVKADQSVIICIRDETAMKITILAGKAKP
jgi:hypothetical protein